MYHGTDTVTGRIRTIYRRGHDLLPRYAFAGNFTGAKVNRVAFLFSNARSRTRDLK